MTRRMAKIPTRVLAAILAGGVSFPIGAALAQNAARVGYVDVDAVLTRSVAGVALRDQLQKEMAAMQKDMDGKIAEVQKLRDEMEKKGALLSAEARKEKQETLERKVRDLQRLKDDYERDLTKKEQELGRRILIDISAVVERVGKQKGYLIIVEKRSAAVIYGSPEADLTDEIIKAYDQDAAKAKK